MLYRGLFKRFVPFFLTFAAGLFIASFFVTIVTPNFSLRGRGSHKHREIQRLRIENKELRKDVLRMRQELEEARKNSLDVAFPVDELSPFDPDVPMPPRSISPRAPKYER